MLFRSSHASSEDRTISGSPRKASKNEVVREGKRVRLEESPESESQGWNPNKIPKLNPSKLAAIDQSAEATMMKPRVSDRARSEAPMVSTLIYIINRLEKLIKWVSLFLFFFFF